VSRIESHFDAGLAVITLADSARGNLLDGESLPALARALSDAKGRPGVRVVLIRSNGFRFCLGMDLAVIEDSDPVSDAVRDSIRTYSEVLLTIFRSPVPVVAVVDGEVKGGGMGLIAASDIVIASDLASFSFSEVLFGLIPANVLPFLLVSRLSLQKAGYLVLTAETIGAEEARRIHLIDEVVAEQTLERRTKAVIRRLFRASPEALASAKSFMRGIIHADVEKACAQAQDQLLEMISRIEVKNGVRRFREGELPSWFGRFQPEHPLILKGKE
jgi:enoyl-CoA hydratase/carnithine racemase